MFEIFCQKDLDRFKSDCQYPEAFCDYLQSRFLEIKQCMEEYYEGDGEFSLFESGPLIVLTAKDNFRDLSEIGFNACDNGIFGDIPEEVSVIETPGGLSFIEVQTAFNNDYLVNVYIFRTEERAYPEFQDYLKRWEPQVKFFKPTVNANKPKKSGC